MVAGIKSSAVVRSRHQLSFRTRDRLTSSKMKVAVIFLAVLACAMAQGYTNKWDNIDLDSILNSQRLLGSYIDCLTEEGNCTPDAKDLKKVLPDALANDCAKCNEKQKQGSEKAIRFLVNKRPELWNRLAKKFDPENVYRVKFEEQAKKAGIAL